MQLLKTLAKNKWVWVSLAAALAATDVLSGGQVQQIIMVLLGQ
jgi:hypothetical protein